MGFEITDTFRANLPVPAPAPFAGFPHYNFIGGHIDADSVPVDDLIAAATRALTADGKTLATYNQQTGPQGFRPLREFVADMLKRRAGMSDNADAVLITSASTQAIALVDNLFIEPGDTVIVEEACYFGALARFAAHNANCIGVRQDADGIDTGHLEDLLADGKASGRPVKMIYTIPTVQNPTGTVMSLERRKRLLALAEAYDCVIFEDDCYADLLWEGDRPPAIRALDTAGDGPRRVVYCGTFSKSIAPALRVGYIVADWPVMAHLLSLKADGGTGALEQMVLAEYCREHFHTHVEQLTAILRDKCKVMIAALEEHFGSAAEFSAPKGGIFIWITLPESVDTVRLAEVALAQGVALNPGPEWAVDGPGNRHRLRLCFGHPSAEIIREGVARLADICHAEFGVPTRSANVARP